MRVRNLVEGRWNFEHARRLDCPPWGLWGGTAGEAGRYLMKLPTDADFKPTAGSHIPVPLDHAGDRAHRPAAVAGAIRSIATPRCVREDVREELVLA